MEERINKTDELKTEKIGKLLLSYSMPAIAAMAVASVYNIIDRIFIGQGVGAMAIAGLAITFPLINLAAAFGSLVGVGASTMISIRLGEGKQNSAMRFLCNSVIINLITGLILGILGLIFLDPILYAFGASEGTIAYARDFMQVILLGNAFTYVYFGLNNILRATGYPTKAMLITIGTVVINLLLAPLFIYYFKWGIRGAAWATVLAQATGAIFVFVHYLNHTHTLYFKKAFFKVHFSVVQKIFTMGMPPFLMNLCASAVVIVLNHRLRAYGGDLAIGAYGIINSIVGLVVMIIFGFNLGMQPIVGYNFGAKQYDRVIRTLKYSLIIGTCISTFGFLLGELFPTALARCFNDDKQLISLTVQGLRIVLISFPLVGGQIIASNFFQAIGMPKVAIFLSLSRQMIFLIPALFVFPYFFGLNGVWSACPFADFLSFLLTMAVLYYHYKKVIRSRHF
ncbi:MAG: MATE family efflux transporter [Lentimicrobiaceae bacterium]|nr:MATE family efflux transporter [Lentimicrobiaceae bacterium]